VPTASGEECLVEVVFASIPARLAKAALSSLNECLPLASHGLQHLHRARRATAGHHNGAESIGGSDALLELILAAAPVWNALGAEQRAGIIRGILGCEASSPSPKPALQLGRARVPGRAPTTLDEHDAGVARWPMRLHRSKLEGRLAAAPRVAAEKSTAEERADPIILAIPIEGQAETAGGAPIAIPVRAPAAAPAATFAPDTFELVILFYKYVALPQPLAAELRSWHAARCRAHGLLGRVLVATEGVNGSLCGPPPAVRAYMAEVQAWRGGDGRGGEGDREGGSGGREGQGNTLALLPPAPFADVDFKLSSHRCGLGQHGQAAAVAPLFAPRCPAAARGAGRGRFGEADECQEEDHAARGGRRKKRLRTESAVAPEAQAAPEIEGDCVDEEMGEVAGESRAASEAARQAGRAFLSLSVRLVPELISTKWGPANRAVASKGDNSDCGIGGGDGSWAAAAAAKQYDDEGAAAAHLSPEAFHAMVREAAEAKKAAKARAAVGGDPLLPGEEVPQQETVVLDIRNSKEHAIGHFEGAVDIGMRSFSEFPAIMGRNLGALKGKRVLMYCTGGIRCEKASAWLRGHGEGFQDVFQLRGGIHKYLDAYGGGGSDSTGGGDGDVKSGGSGEREPCLFKGKNFVFDGRVALAPADHDGGRCAESTEATEAAEAAEATGGATTVGADASTEAPPAAATSAAGAPGESPGVVGRCGYCGGPWEVVSGDAACVVCRDPVLACDGCRPGLAGELHCPSHMHLRHCYFGSLARWADVRDPANATALRAQADGLEGFERLLRGDRAMKNRRRTLRRQRERVEALLAAFLS